MLALGSQACSSRRTIRSPHRAVERQWIRRTSSPCRYSRTSASSWPTTPIRCGRASPVLPAAADRADGRQRHDPRRHHHLAGRDELAVQLHQTERVDGSYGQRARGEAAAYPAEQRVLHHPPPAQIRPVHQESGAGAQLARHGVLEQQDPGRQPAILAEHDLAFHR